MLLFKKKFYTVLKDLMFNPEQEEPRPVAAHLLGYVGGGNKRKGAKDNYYIEGDYIELVV